MPARFSLTQPDRALLLALRTVIVTILKENPALTSRLAEIVAKEHIKPLFAYLGVRPPPMHGRPRASRGGRSALNSFILAAQPVTPAARAISMRCAACSACSTAARR